MNIMTQHKKDPAVILFEVFSELYDVSPSSQIVHYLDEIAEKGQSCSLGELEHGLTSLHFAVVLRRYDVIKTLLAETSKSQQYAALLTHEDIRGFTPLHLAYIMNDPDLIQVIQESCHRSSSSSRDRQPEKTTIKTSNLDSPCYRGLNRNSLNVTPQLFSTFLYGTGRLNSSLNFQFYLFDPNTKQIRVLDVKGFEDMFGVRFIQHSLFSLSYLRYLLTVKIPIPIGESVKARYKPLVDREMGILAEGNQSAATNNNFILCKINDYIGYGLFAARSFHQHEFLTVYCGIIEDSRVSSEFAPSNKPSNKTYNLCTVLEPIVINASSHRNLSAFINSSYYPNAYLRGYFDHAQTISILVSLVPIKKGEQITFAYDSDGSWFQNFNINPVEMMMHESEENFPRKIDLSQCNIASTNGNLCPHDCDGDDDCLWTCGYCYRTERQTELRVTCDTCGYFKFCDSYCQQQATYHHHLCPRLAQLKALRNKKD